MDDLKRIARRRRYELLGGLLLGLGALVLRIWGAGWSLPYIDHPDEPAVMNVVLRLVGGQRDPQFFFYPSLVLYVQAVVVKLHVAWGLAAGLYHAPLLLPATTDVLTTIPGAFLWTRCLSALCGAATVVVMAVGGARSVGRPAALLAAALLMLSPWAVTHAHFMTVDIPSALAALCAILGTLAILERGSWRTYLVSGLALGFAMATKYQNGLLVLPMLVAHVLHWRGQTVRKSGRVIGAGMIAALIFLATSPYIVLDAAVFLRDIGTLFGSYHGQHGDVTGAWPLGAYLDFLWWQGLGPVGTLFFLVGAVTLLRAAPARAIVLLAFPCVLLLALLRVESHFFRNMLPLQPPLLYVAGYGGVQLWKWAKQLVALKWRAPTAVAAIAIVLLPSAVAVMTTDAAFGQPDSRVLAQMWTGRVWPGTRVAAELEHPITTAGVTQLTTFSNLAAHSLTWYREQGYGLLLLSSAARRSWDLPAPYRALATEGAAVERWGGPGSGERGPRLDLIDTGLLATLPKGQAFDVTIGPIQLDAASYGQLRKTQGGPEVVMGAPVRAGAVLGITAFWRRTGGAVPAVHYTTFIQLRDTAGRTVAQRDTPPWNDLFPLATWRLGARVEEALDLPVPATVAAGTYRLVLGMYDQVSGERLPVRTARGPGPRNEVDLGPVVVTR